MFDMFSKFTMEILMGRKRGINKINMEYEDKIESV